MNKLLLVLTGAVAFGSCQMQADSYNERAERNVYKRKVREHQEEVRAEKERLIQQDMQAFVEFINGIVYVVGATGKVICQMPIEEYQEKVVGSIGAGLVAIVSAAGLYHLFKKDSESAEPKKKRHVAQQKKKQRVVYVVTNQ